MENNPILLKLHKGREVEDKRIASGFVSGEMGKQMGVRRKTFETEEGEKMYAYKEVANLKEAKDTMQIYLDFKEAGIPVVSFAKIIKKKVNGRDEFVIAMEDLTDNDKMGVVEIKDLESVKELVLPFEMKEDIIKSLAQIHNMGIYDYHPGISFVIRFESKDDEVRAIDFKVIDYANFETLAQAKERADKGESLPTGFEVECRRDLNVIIRSIADGANEIFNLTNLYEEIRRSVE